MPTYQHAITLQPGESFILPPGATIVGSTDSDALDSSCGDNIPVVEFKCYAFVSPQTIHTGSHTEIFQQENIEYTGILLNSKYYPFATIANWYEDDVLTQQLKSISVMSGLILSVSYAPILDSTYGHKKYIVFSTIASIGDNLELVARTQLPVAGSGYITYYLRAKERDLVEGDGNDGMPQCPTITNLN